MAKKKKMRLSRQLEYNHDRAKEIWGWGWNLSEHLKEKARKGHFSWENLTAWDIKEAILAFNEKAEDASKQAMNGNWLIALEYIKTVEHIVGGIKISLVKKVRAEHGWNF